MAMNDALLFVERIRGDPLFRRECYRAETAEDFSRVISGGGYQFRDHEIADAFRTLLLKAADEEAAAEIRELEQWFNVQSRPEPAGSACAVCGFKTGCCGFCP